MTTTFLENAEGQTIALTLNGERRSLQVQPWITLLDLLRDQLDLVGTKKGCDHGQCGACTVLRDGKRINACLTLAIMKDGADVMVNPIHSGCGRRVAMGIDEIGAFRVRRVSCLVAPGRSFDENATACEIWFLRFC